jgi:hypothetical protein
VCQRKQSEVLSPENVQRHIQLALGEGALTLSELLARLPFDHRQSLSVLRVLQDEGWVKECDGKYSYRR